MYGNGVVTGMHRTVVMHRLILEALLPVLITCIVVVAGTTLQGARAYRFAVTTRPINVATTLASGWLAVRNKLGL